MRWSCEGHLLASGGDDKLVMIWKLTGEGSSSIFGGGGKVIQNSIYKYLQMHKKYILKSGFL